MIGIADTGFLVAFCNRRDRFHAWAANLAQEITEPLLTCEPVLAETAFHLGSSTIVLQMLDTGLCALRFQVDEHRSRLVELAEKYADRHPDLADLCLIRMSELRPKHPILTVDGDFRIYRRNKRDVIPTISPDVSS